MNDFSITMPIGQIRIVMGLNRLMRMFAHEIVHGDVIHTMHPDDQTIFAVGIQDLPTQVRTVPHKLRETLDVRRELMLNRNGSHERIVEAVMKFMEDRFKEFASKKEVAFYAPDLDLAKVEELGYAHMENMGSDNSVLCIFKLSEYHKFAVLVDLESFKFYRNENGTHGELVEINPTKWVIGRYDNDLKIMKQIEGMRRYTP